MVNSEEFAARLQRVMDHYQLNGSSFAESIGVQRSAISHILSSRNKPSLEFVMKILEAYPDIELYWLLNGKGNNPFKSVAETPADDLFSTQEHAKAEPAATKGPAFAEQMPVGNSKRVTKVLIFYDDNTFEELVKVH
ncbi:helix-turn-helix domain-containing protein [Robertkochia sediminum]|uniref:helix-turn-helix domain-containing protein n=1 Tax=Robertkochia sediminum TaxID=2785326 RepID=UPI001934AD27|nr:helix-turn-helix transcriptional regulator [Robertkochia sediminum]MBL7473485.1 helix-turn-helix transcriptional regulator [Robertkochia sediminum]